MNPSKVFTLCLLCLVALASGCASDQALRADAAGQDLCGPGGTLVLRTHTEVATLRSEMATIRIEAAKKDAELQQLRHQVGVLQADRAKLQQIQVEQQAAMEEQGEMLQAVRRERDELAAANRRPGTVVAGVPQGAPISQGRAAASRADDKVQALEASIVALTTQIQHLNGQASEESREPQAQPVYSIRVERGDTLGKLAMRHGVSVAEIQEANGLTGDLILAGQRLFIPRPPLLSP